MSHSITFIISAHYECMSKSSRLLSLAIPIKCREPTLNFLTAWRLSCGIVDSGAKIMTKFTIGNMQEVGTTKSAGQPQTQKLIFPIISFDFQRCSSAEFYTKELLSTSPSSIHFFSTILSDCQTFCCQLSDPQQCSKHCTPVQCVICVHWKFNEEKSAIGVFS